MTPAVDLAPSITGAASLCGTQLPLSGLSVDAKARAWNPSLIVYGGKVLVAYNWAPKSTHRPGARQIRIAELDDGLQVVRDQEVKLDGALEVKEDMRLFIHGGRLHGVYFEGTVHQRSAGLVLATFDDELNITACIKPVFGRHRRLEKNWQFFSHGGQLLCVYNVQPHVVLGFRGEQGVLAAKTEWVGSFDGQICGGTPPLEMDGEYLSFFHSWVPWPERGRSSWTFRLYPAMSLLRRCIAWPMFGAGTWPHRIYHVGAYTFNKKRPFNVLKYTPRPLLSGGTADAPPNRPACVFPCGACWRRGQVLVSYGYHDEQCRLALFSPESLRERLTPVQVGT
jgi:hypothetical protein